MGSVPPPLNPLERFPSRPVQCSVSHVLQCFLNPMRRSCVVLIRIPFATFGRGLHTRGSRLIALWSCGKRPWH